MDAHETLCQNPTCRHTLQQIPGGHRRRLYCDDTCRQQAFRARQVAEQGRQCAEQVKTWGSFQPATIDYLVSMFVFGGQEQEAGARKLAALIREEQGGLHELQERYRAYVARTNERLEALTGELAAARQERERSAKPKPLAKSERQELEQARADLLRLYQERARGSEEIHRLSELAHELGAKLGAARNRITELESSGQQGQAPAPSDAVEKLLRLGERVRKLEQQVEIQRQQLGQYHQRFYPSSLAVAQQRLMALGAALHYKILLKYDAHAVEVGSGEQTWREFASHADLEGLSQAILQAQFLFENLRSLGMVGNRDSQAETH